MWLHGKAGCGKTVLSSIIISEVDRICRFDGVAVTYFYFDFNDTEKQDANKMICSIIKQLVSQSTNKCIRLESLFSTCNDGARQPNSDDLMLVLEGTMKAFDKVYIILDALDECSDRHNLLEKIEKIQNWRLSQLHMLLTSRALTDIEEALEPMIDVKSRICIQNAAVNADIGVYVDQMLQKDRHLKRWRNHKQAQKEIRKALKEKADGMSVCHFKLARLLLYILGKLTLSGFAGPYANLMRCKTVAISRHFEKRWRLCPQLWMRPTLGFFAKFRKIIVNMHSGYCSGSPIRDDH